MTPEDGTYLLLKLDIACGFQRLGYPRTRALEAETGRARVLAVGHEQRECENMDSGMSPFM